MNTLLQLYSWHTSGNVNPDTTQPLQNGDQSLYSKFKSKALAMPAMLLMNSKQKKSRSVACHDASNNKLATKALWGRCNTLNSSCAPSPLSGNASPAYIKYDSTDPGPSVSIQSWGQASWNHVTARALATKSTKGLKGPWSKNRLS